MPMAALVLESRILKGTSFAELVERIDKSRQENGTILSLDLCRADLKGARKVGRWSRQKYICIRMVC
jgi:hypothetical protein